MPKLARVHQKQFGLNGPLGEFGQFGSKKNQPQQFTLDPNVMQSLNAFLNGLGDCTVGNYEPPLEDINSLFYLLFYQTCYFFQQGTPEYHASMTYYIGSMVNVNGVLYVSLVDNNLGNTPGSVSSTVWQAIGNVIGADIASASAITVGSDGCIYRVTGSTNINTISNPNAIPKITLIFAGVLNVTTSGNLILPNGTFTTQINGTLELLWQASTGKWIEICRSPNPVPVIPPQVGLGNRINRSLNSTAQAATDGFFCGTVYGEDSINFSILSDASASPGTTVGFVRWSSTTTNCGISFCIPIKKNDYYVLTRGGSGDFGNSGVDLLYFIPLGS